MHAAGFSHSLTLISVCLIRPVYPSRIACPAGRSGGVFLRPVRLAVADLAAQPSDDAEDVHESRGRAEHEKQQQEPRLGSQPPIEEQADADAARSEEHTSELQ